MNICALTLYFEPTNWKALEQKGEVVETGVQSNLLTATIELSATSSTQ